MAEVEGAQELFLANPLLALHHLQVHQADLANRPAEGEPAELEEVPEDLAQAHHGFVPVPWVAVRRNN